MAQPVNNLKKRRKRNLAITSTLIVLTLFAASIAGVARAPVALYTGLLLYAVIVLLSFFNARKKIPLFPLLRVSTWLQFHIYAGIFSIALYIGHAGLNWPRGTLEIILSILFAIVCVSGLFGIFISRWLPKVMNLSGEAITYEKIPTLRKDLIEKLDLLIREAERETGSSTLSEFYLQRLRPYLCTRPNYWNFSQITKSSAKLKIEADELDRYLNETEQGYALRLSEAIEQKRHMDVIEAATRQLRTWLFIHIPCTYSLLILGLVHGLVALTHGGSH